MTRLLVVVVVVVVFQSKSSFPWQRRVLIGWCCSAGKLGNKKKPGKTRMESRLSGGRRASYRSRPAAVASFLFDFFFARISSNEKSKMDSDKIK